jgi:hypothetical protein
MGKSSHDTLIGVPGQSRRATAPTPADLNIAHRAAVCDFRGYSPIQAGDVRQGE